MSGYVLILRPEPGLSRSMAAAKEMGLNAIGYPLFEIVPREWECPDPTQIDALLIGSANAVRHGGEAIERLKGKPVYAVGQSTADAAREAGFEIAACGTGGLQNVVDAIEPPLRLLRLSGAEHVPLYPQSGINIHNVIAYEAKPLELPEPLRPLHDLGLTVLLHSAAAARQFAWECKRLAMQRSRIQIVAIGPRVAQAAGEGWRAIHISTEPSDSAMLEMVRDVCI